MAEVVSLHGNKVEVDDGTKGLVTRLKEMIAQIEAGEIKPEKWILIVESTRPDNPAILSTRSYDSGVTLAEAVYILDGAVYDIHCAARNAVP